MTIDPNNLAATATMTFDDEFNNLSLWNGTSGTWSTTYIFADPNGNGSTLQSNGEQEWYINNLDSATSSVKPWTVSNGVLNLTAAPASSTISPLINNYQYTSGLLETSHSFSQTYGYFEMRAELPSGQGLWPAFWLLPQSGAWPPELDVMEMLGNDTSTYYTTVHSNTISGSQSGFGSNTADTASGYHTYAVDWEPDYITWYFDGHAIYRTATPSDMNQPMYMLLNLAVGGYWPGDANSTTQLPADMKVDWVRAYSANPNATSTSESTAVAAHGSGDVLTATGSKTALSSGGSVTSTTMLSTGDIVTVGAQSGGSSAVGNLFSSAGAAAGSAVSLVGSGSNLTPVVTALAGGMWEVSYTGANAPAGYQVYNSSGASVFYVDAFSTGNPQFAALGAGGYVETSNSWNGRFNITEPDGTIKWFNLPTDSSGAALNPTAITALGDGGFAFTYANSAEIDRYSYQGGVQTKMTLASTPTGAAPAIVGLTDGVTEAAWVNSSGALSIQAFNTYGTANTSAIALATGLSSSAQVKMLATGVHDQSLVLWSSGGATYGASFNGATATSAVSLAPVALDSAKETVLTDGKVALTWLETDNGVQHLWVEVLDPSNMQATKHDLGAADGNENLIALSGGGFAESWHTGGAIDGIAYDGLGDYGSATQVSGDFVGQDSSGDVIAVGVDSSGAATEQTYSLSGGATSTGVISGTMSGDYLGSMLSASLIENSNGQVAVAQIGASGAETYTTVAALGSEWTFVGSGDYLGSGSSQFLIENSKGVVDVGSVENGKVDYTQVGALGSEWKFVGSGDYLGDGTTGFLIENSNGAVVEGEVGAGGKATYTQVAALGSEWSFEGSGDFLGKGHDQFLIENAKGSVAIGEVENGKVSYQTVAALGSEWKFVGVGDFLSDGKTGFLVENSSGAVVVGEIGSDGKATYTPIAGLGSEWKFVGTGDYLGEGHSQFLIENTKGSVAIGDVVDGHIHFTTVGALGSEWTFHG